MYKIYRGAALAVLRLPEGPPTAPPGGSVVRTFNASPRYLAYRLIGVWIGAGVFLFGAIGLALGAHYAAAIVLAIVDLAIRS